MSWRANFLRTFNLILAIWIEYILAVFLWFNHVEEHLPFLQRFINIIFTITTIYNKFMRTSHYYINTCKKNKI